MKKKSNVRTREASLIVYMQQDELLKMIVSLQLYHNLKHFAFIKHDMDEKEPHYHLYLYFINARELKGIYWLVKSYTKSNVMIEAVHDKYSLVNEYFIHKGYEDKYQYPKDNVVMDDERFFQGTTEENKTIDMLLDIIAGCPLIEMAKKYGRDYIINKEKYDRYAELMKDTMKNEELIKINNKED